MNEGVQPRPPIDMAQGDIPDREVSDDEATPKTLDGDKRLQRLILGAIERHNQKGKPNRMAEVQGARDRRLYFKDIQQFHWSEDTQDVIFDTDDDYDRSFNIFQGYGKIFISLFMGARAKNRPEADNPFDGTVIRNTTRAQGFERLYRKWNDVAMQQLKISFLLWNDGRVISRTVQREGRQITEFWGVLESRLPISAPEDDEIPLKNCMLIELENEFPEAQLKRDYPDSRKDIEGGHGSAYERNARMAVKRQAGTDTAMDIGGDDNYGMATKTWSYMRPEFFEEFSTEAEREEVAEMFPAGLCVVHTGSVYLESYECDIDAELDVIHALPGDGQSRGSIGQTTFAIQDSVNSAQNLIEDTFDHGIPTIYYDKATNINELNKQRAQPGDSRIMVRNKDEPAANHFYSTPVTQPSAQLMQYAENLRGPQAQFASALPPAAFGQEMEDQKTASGYAQARTQALGQLAIVWKPFTAWKTRELTRAIRMAARQQDDIQGTVPSDRPGGRPTSMRIAPTDLQGISFTNESDENFPETWTERSNKLMQLIQLGGPIADVILDKEPSNFYMLKQLWGLEDLAIPTETVMELVLEEIAAMENERRLPDPSQMPEQMLPIPGQPPPVPQLISSRQIDHDIMEPEDWDTAYKVCKHWLLTTGREMQEGNAEWVANVRAYALQYKQARDEAAQANAPKPDTKPMSLAGNFKDLPPEAQAAALQRDGLPAQAAKINGDNPQMSGSVSDGR